MTERRETESENQPDHLDVLTFVDHIMTAGTRVSYRDRDSVSRESIGVRARLAVRTRWVRR